MNRKSKSRAQPNGARFSRKSDQLSIVRQSAPAAYGVSRSVLPPQVNGSKGHIIKVARKEFLGTATNGNTTGYALTGISAGTPGYDINPGNVLMFPWLSQMAICFERYSLKKLKFHFIPSQSTATAGRYYAAVDYDYDDDVASSKVQLMGNRTAIESPVWQECDLVCNPSELHRDMPAKYVSYSSRVSAEPRTVYAGYLMVAFDTPTANLLVDIWVEYEVDLISPVNDSQVIQNTISAMTVTSVADVTLAVGGTFVGVPEPSPIVVPGPIRNVTTSGAVPALVATLGGGSYTFPRAFDISLAPIMGSLIFEFLVVVAGDAPDDIFDVAELTPLIGVWNSFGAYLGDLPSVPGAHNIVGVTGSVPSSMSTVGATARMLLQVAMTRLFTTFPTARYLTPFYTSVAALGAGATAIGVDYMV